MKRLISFEFGGMTVRWFVAGFLILLLTVGGAQRINAALNANKALLHVLHFYSARQAGNLPGAVVELQNIIVYQPMLAQSHLGQRTVEALPGWARVQLPLIEQIQTYQRVQDWVSLADRYQSIGAFPEAVAAYQIALALRPSDVSALYGLSQVYQALGDTAASDEAVDHLLSMVPTYPVECVAGEMGCTPLANGDLLLGFDAERAYLDVGLCVPITLFWKVRSQETPDPSRASSQSEIEYHVGDRRYVVTCLPDLLSNGGFEVGIDPTLVPSGWYAGWSSSHEQDDQVRPDLSQGGHRFQMQAFPTGKNIRALMTSGKAVSYIAGAAVSAVEVTGSCCVQIAWIDSNWRTLPWLGPGGTPVMTPRGCVLSGAQTFQFLFSEPSDANWLALDLTAMDTASGRCEFDHVFIFPLAYRRDQKDFPGRGELLSPGVQ